jgi:hypothetical protein
MLFELVPELSCAPTIRYVQVVDIRVFSNSLLDQQQLWLSKQLHSELPAQERA